MTTTTRTVRKDDPPAPQGPHLGSGRWVRGVERPAGLRRGALRHVLREQPGRLARPLGRHSRSGVVHPRAAPTRRGLGGGSSQQRDRAARYASSRSASGHRLRRARVPGARDAPRRAPITTRSRDQVSGVDALAAAVEPFDLERAAADRRTWSPKSSTQLLDTVRRVGRVAIETGTGITMAASANVTQWLAWALDDPHRLDEPPRWGAGSIPDSRTSSRRTSCRSRRPTVRSGRGRPAGPKRTRSWVNGRARSWPTRSAPATSAQCSTSVAIC